MKRSMVVVLSLVIFALPLAAQDKPYTAAILIEPSTKTVLFEENARTPLPVASMTKMMTLLIALDRIRAGELTLDTPVNVSARAASMGGSQVFLRAGAQFPVRALLAATMIHSANDAATALAEHIGGSNEAFAELMNQKAQELGMKQSRFYSPHGLPATETPDDVMSAYDAALAGMELMSHGIMRQYAKMQEAPFKSGTFERLYNPNRLLKIMPDATGIKTGFHNKAGFCVTASASRNGMDLVAVVMGTPPARKNENFTSAAEILNRGFAQWRMQQLVKRGQPIKDQAKVEGGVSETVGVVAGGDISILAKRGQQNGGAEVQFVPTNLAAPVTQGQQIGTIVVKQGGKVTQKVPALAAAAVPATPWYRRLWPF